MYTVRWFRSSCSQVQNQNSLLVIRQIDNFSPGAVTGLALTRDGNFDTQSSDNLAEEIGEDIPVSGGLRKETTFICFYTSRGYLKCHGMLISATSSLGDNVICRYAGSTFQTFV